MAMPQIRKYSISPRTTPTSPTFEQLLKDEVHSPTNTFGTNHNDQEEYMCSTPNKKSVLAKVKERAKKLKYSLSIKRKQILEPNDGGTPHSGVNFDDCDDDPDEEDPEYLGAPMYESEAAPESLRENARQHPRAVPVVSENRKVPNVRTTKHIETAQEEKPNKIEAVSEKLRPAYEAVSDANRNITSKIASLTTVSDAETRDAELTLNQNPGATEHIEGETRITTTSAKPNHQSSTSPRTWDKTVSVKEYLMNKLEPGDDERALSQAIAAAITTSPRTSSSGDAGVMQKMKGAVTSLFRQDMPSDSSSKGPSSSSVSNVITNVSKGQKQPINSARSHSAKAFQTPATNSALTASRSSRAHQALEDTHGKILQPN